MLSPVYTEEENWCFYMEEGDPILLMSFQDNIFRLNWLPLIKLRTIINIVSNSNDFHIILDILSTWGSNEGTYHIQHCTTKLFECLNFCHIHAYYNIICVSNNNVPEQNMNLPYSLFSRKTISTLLRRLLRRSSNNTDSYDNIKPIQFKTIFEC